MALNKIDPSKVKKVVSTMDPSIDQEAMGEEAFKKYSENYDFSLLKFKQGEFPTIFLVMNVLPSEEAKIKQEHFLIEFPEISEMNPDQLKTIKPKELKPKVIQKDTQEMMIKYFNSGISKYEENGVEFPCSANTFPFSIVQEIGAHIMTRTQLGDDLKNA